MFPGLSGGFAGIGNAHATITIDTSSAEQARQTMRQVGNDIQRSMRGASSAVTDVNRAIGSMRTELLAIGAAGGIVTALGLGSARNIRNFRVAFRTLTGDVESGDEAMASLVDNASKFGLELESTLQLGRSLLPSLEGGTEELDKWVTRAAMLRSTFPIAQRGAETRAITEFLAGQTMSLQRLFDISPSVIQEAQDATNDLGEQLDIILQKQGATEASALQMADAWVSVKNELKLLLAEGFQPTFEWLQSNLRVLREWLTEIRQTSPEVARLGANLATVAAVGAPTLLFLNQVIGALQKIRALSIGGVGLGRLLGAGAIAGGAAFAVQAGIRQEGRNTGDERLATITFREMLVDAAEAVSRIFTIVEIKFLDAADSFNNAVFSMVDAVGRFVSWMGDVLPDWAGGARLRAAGSNIQASAAERRAASSAGIAALQQQAIERQIEATESLAVALGVMTRGMEAAAREQAQMQRVALQEEARRTPGVAGTGAMATFSDEQMARIQAWDEFQSDLAEIEQQAAMERLQATEQYEAQRNQMVAGYNQTLLREEEDFLRQRARQNAQLQSQIDDINAERAEAEAEWQADLNESVAEAREASGERLIEIEEDYAQRRERLQEDHRLSLLEAASRLDAAAVAQEQLRFNQQMDRLDEDEQQALDQERQRLQERIEQEQEAHQERLENAREADAKRIADLREGLAERQALEDEDRAIRLERMQEDHEAQLAALDDQHQARLDQIDAQEQEALDERERQFTRQQIALTDFYDEWLRTQRSRQRMSLEAWGDFWDDFQDGMTSGASGGSSNAFFDGPGDLEESGATMGDRPTRSELIQMFTDEARQRGWSNTQIGQQITAWRTRTAEQIAGWMESIWRMEIPGYLAGTDFVPQTGPAMLHRGEAVLNPAQAQQYRAGRGAITIQEGAINMPIYAAPGQSAEEIGSAVRQQLQEFIDSL